MHPEPLQTGQDRRQLVPAPEGQANLFDGRDLEIGLGLEGVAHGRKQWRMLQGQTPESPQTFNRSSNIRTLPFASNPMRARSFPALAAHSLALSPQAGRGKCPMAAVSRCTLAQPTIQFPILGINDNMLVVVWGLGFPVSGFGFPLQCLRSTSRWSTRRVWWYSSGGRSVRVGDSVSLRMVLASACKARQRGQSRSGVCAICRNKLRHSMMTRSMSPGPSRSVVQSCLVSGFLWTDRKSTRLNSSHLGI